METITINLKEIGKLVEDGVNIFLDPEAEESLIQLLEIQKQVEDAIKIAKEEIERRGLAINPNFKSIQGDNIRIGYRYFGAEYKIDEANVDKLPNELYSTKTSYSVETKALKTYLQEHKGIPVGIVANERKKTITFALKGADDGDE